MGASLDFTLRRNNGTDTDELNPTTRWSQINEKPDTFTPTAHSHGNISDTGTISAAVTPASTDYLLVSDASNSGKIAKGVAIGTGTTTFLRNDGTWATPADSTTLAGLGITATSAEINTLDGITATVTELNYTDGVTSNIQTQLDAKAVLSYWDNITSASRMWGGIITSNGDGTVAIAAGAGLSKATSASPEDVPTSLNGGQGSHLSYVTWSAVSSLALTDNAYNFIYYKGSTNTILATTDFYVVDFTRDFTLGRAYRSGTSVIVRLCGTNSWNFNRRVQLFGEEVFPIVTKKGSMIIGSSGRYINHNGGVLWAELVNRFTVNSFDSSGTDRFTYWYGNSTSGYTAVTGQSLISNTQYYNGTALASLTVNKYGVNWVYVVHDGTVHVVYGTGDYTLSQAEATTPPTQIPGLLAAYATLIGRVIIQQGASSLTEVASAFTTVFNSTATSIHNELAGRNDADAHPISAITSLQSTLDAKLTSASTLDASKLSGTIPAAVLQTEWDSAYTATNAATNANTASTIVKRDASGNFSAGTITAALTGTASGNLTSSSTLDASKLSGTIPAAVAQAEWDGAATATTAATNLNTAATIVKRDGSGNFSAGTITASLTGTASGNLTSSSTLDASKLSGTIPAAVAQAEWDGAATATTAATNLNTAATIVKRDASGNFSAGTITAALTGNSSTATKLATARSIALSGDVTGSANFDGSADISITATVADDSHNHIISNVDGLQTALDGKLSTSGKAADSELLDGIDSTNYARTDIEETFTNNVIIQGNLTVSGTSTTVNTETVNLADNIIVLNSNETAAPTQNAGIEIERGTSSNVSILFSEDVDRWKFTNDGTTYYQIPTTSEYTNNTGTVTSVAMTVPTGLSISGSPITTSGTLGLTLTSGYSIPTTANQTNWSTAYGWGNHASAGYLTSASTLDASKLSGTIPAAVAQTEWDSAYTATNAATDINTVSTIVKRDASGNFSAGTITAALTGNASSATYASAVTLTADNSGAATYYPLFSATATGNVSPRTDTGFTYNASTGVLTATNFTGAVTGTASGNLTSASTLDASKLSGTIPAAVAQTEWDSAYTATNAATNANTVSTIVKRDASGNFSAGTITAALTGTASGNLTSASTLDASKLSGTIPAAVAQAEWDSAYTATNAATNANTVSTIVKRDASGNFSAGTITAALTGTASGNLTSASSLDPSKVSQTSSYRFVTDAEKSTWNGKLDKSGGTLTGDLTLEKDGTADVGSHGIVFQANTTALGDYTKELNIDVNGNLKFDGATLLTGTYTADRVMVTNGSGNLEASLVTTTELNVLDGLTASTTELNYVDGVTSAIQTQLDGKAATSHAHGNITSAGKIGTVGALAVDTGADGTLSTRAVSNSASPSSIGTSTNFVTEQDIYYGLVAVNGGSQTRATTIYAPTSAGTSGQILVSSGGTPGWTTKEYVYTLASDYANSTTTLATATGMTSASLAIGTYRVSFIGSYRTAATTTGIKLGAYMPSGAANVRGLFTGQKSSATVATDLTQSFYAIGASNTSGSTILTTGVSSTTTDHFIGFEAIVRVTTAGTIAIQIASEVTASAATLKAGSTMHIVKLA